jgi:hypothetical protein
MPPSAEPGRGVPSFAAAADWMEDAATRLGALEIWVVLPQVRAMSNVASAFGVDRGELESVRRVTRAPFLWEFHIKSSLPRVGPLSHPVLGAWIDDPLIETLEDLQPPLLCVLQHLRDDGKRWIAAYGPTDIATGERVAKSGPITDPAALDGLKVMTWREGISHPRDKEAAVKALKALHEAGQLPAPDALRQWGVEHDLTFADANKLAHWAEQLHAGKTVRSR